MVGLWIYGASHVFWAAYAPALHGHEGALRGVMHALGALTLVVGGLGALTQRHLKRLLAFSTISHMGIVLLGFGALEAHGAGAAVLYVVAHGFVKGALFLCTGALQHSLGDVDELRLYGKARGLKLVGAAWLTGGLLLAGLPPFALWLGASSIHEELRAVGVGELAWLIVVGEALTGAAVLRAGVRVFIGRGQRGGVEEDGPTGNPGRETDRCEGVPWVMAGPIVALLLLALVLPLWRTLPALVRSGDALLKDHDRYAAGVLADDGPRALALPQVPYPPGVLHGLVSVAAALALAALMLSTRLTQWKAVAAGLRALGRLHSGRPGDYVAMVMLGAAAIGVSLVALVAP
jgi:multicomponent Na+:H+ antiporter subunit D